MFDILKSILHRIDADYADIRYEVLKDTTIAFNGRESTQVSSTSSDGFVVRVLKQGGMSAVSFTKQGEADKAVRAAAENALLFSRNSDKPVRIAPAEIVKDQFMPALAEDPRSVTLAEKLELTRRYNGIPLAHEQVVTTSTSYSEVCREKYFASTEGSEIREDLVTTGIRGLITTKDGNLLQNIRVAAGGSDGFGTVRNQERQFEEQTALAIGLLRAKPVASGVYNCVVNPDLAGVFAHEAFGHFSEADIVETLPAMREKMRIGSQLGSSILNITDDATAPGQLGFYRYDDEGVRIRPTPLISDGVLCGRLHSRRTAAEFGEPLSGHCVAENYTFAPIVRMGTIFIKPGRGSLDELLAMLGDGLYLLDAKGGQTAGENFTFGANYGYLVKGGKVGEMVRDINISGNLYQTLRDIAAVGGDFELSRTGGCGKGQTNIKSCHGGPHSYIKNLVIGGI